MELLIATNPDPDSTLPYLLRLPIGDGLVFRTKGTWPRTSALYCHPVPDDEWADEPDIIERVPLRSCARRGAAIDVVADRGREQRSQIVFTNARGREMVFWQSPRTRKQARPDVRLPTARAAGIAKLEIVVDAHEKYAYRFDAQQVRTVVRGLPCGDYAVSVGRKLIAAVERKSLADLVSSLISGRLRFALGELAGLPRAAVVVEDRYSQVFTLERVRPAQVADGLAELRFAGRPSRSCSARTASWPRSGPTATWPPPTPGPATSCRPSLGSGLTRTASGTLRPSLRPRPLRSGPGPAPTGSWCPSVAGSGPRSTRHGRTPRAPEGGIRHADLPLRTGWRPADEVRRRQTVERKAAFIHQVMSNQVAGREIDDIGEVALSYAEVKALATGNPLILEKAGVDNELARLLRLRQAHRRDQAGLDRTVASCATRASRLGREVTALQAAVDRRQSTAGDAFAMTVQGRRHTRRADAGVHLLAVLSERLDKAHPGPASAPTVIGELGGLPLELVTRRDRGAPPEATLQLGSTPVQVHLSASDLAASDAISITARLEHRLRTLDATLAATADELGRTTREADAAQARLGAPFPHAARLATLETRKAEIEAALLPQPDDPSMVAGGRTDLPLPLPSTAPDRWRTPMSAPPEPGLGADLGL